MINKCGHSFEREEITNWLKSHNTCPSCRIECDQNDIIRNYQL
jgi:SUMO ligase MMS21 Smc5/6 complex component